MKTIKWIILLGVGALVAVTGYLYSGLYPMGADVPHNNATYWLLKTLRERSIARAASDITTETVINP